MCFSGYFQRWSLVELWAVHCSPVSQLKNDSTRDNFLKFLVITTKKSAMDSYSDSNLEYF